MQYQQAIVITKKNIMKTRLYILSAFFTLLSIYSNAQTRINKTSVVPTVTKGYYSIGRNAEKLDNVTTLAVVQSTTYYTTQKGYYTINEKRYKLPKFYSVNVSPSGAKIPVKKGYYSIGNNTDKLK